MNDKMKAIRLKYRSKSEELCQCGRRTYLAATRNSEWKEVPHCPRCEGPALYCECDDYIPTETPPKKRKK